MELVDVYVIVGIDFDGQRHDLEEHTIDKPLTEKDIVLEVTYQEYTHFNDEYFQYVVVEKRKKIINDI